MDSFDRNVTKLKGLKMPRCLGHRLAVLASNDVELVNTKLSNLNHVISKIFSPLTMMTTNGECSPINHVVDVKVRVITYQLLITTSMIPVTVQTKRSAI